MKQKIISILYIIIFWLEGKRQEKFKRTGLVNDYMKFFLIDDKSLLDPTDRLHLEFVEWYVSRLENFSYSRAHHELYNLLNDRKWDT